MHKFCKMIVLTVLSVACLIITAGAVDCISINDLIENANDLDGQIVSVEGEVIGEEMERGEYSWININDGTNAIGVWLAKADTADIEHFGDYKYKGDILRITGTFSRDCTQHGGDVDIHCRTLEIIETGDRIKEIINANKVAAGILLLFIALLTVVIYFIINKRSKNDSNLK